MARRHLLPTAVLAALALLGALLAVVVPDAVADPAPRVTEVTVDSPNPHTLGPITTDSTGHLWVGETDRPVVDELSADGSTITQAVDLSASGTVGGTLTGGITALTAGPDGSVWATSSTDSAVVRIDPTTDPATATFATTSAAPQGIQTIGGGAWWVTQSTPPELDYGTFDAGGPSIGLVATFDLPVGSAPTALALGLDDESVWVALSGAGEIDHVDVTQTSSMSEIHRYTTADDPDGVAVDAQGVASYVTDNGSADEVGRIDPSDDSQSANALDSGASSIVLGPDGNAWFTLPSASEVGAITPIGAITTYALNAPATVTGLTVATDGMLWAAAAQSKVDKVPTDVALADPVADPLAVTGTLTEGQTIGHTSPALRGTAPTATVVGAQWNRCDADGDPSSCSPITGATSDTYTLTSDDAGQTISVTIATTNPAGTTDLTSDPSAVVTALPPPTTTTSTTTTAPPPPVTDPPAPPDTTPPTTVPPGPTADQIHQFFLILFFMAVVRAQQAAKCHTVVTVVHHKKVSRLVCKR